MTDKVHWPEHQWCEVECKNPHCKHKCSQHLEVGHPGGSRPCLEANCMCQYFVNKWKKRKIPLRPELRRPKW